MGYLQRLYKLKNQLDNLKTRGSNVYENFKERAGGQFNEVMRGLTDSIPQQAYDEGTGKMVWVMPDRARENPAGYMMDSLTGSFVPGGGLAALATKRGTLGTVGGMKALNFSKAEKAGQVFDGAVDHLKRFEIPDTLAKINPEFLKKFNTMTDDDVAIRPLGKILDHPELYNNYPDMQNIPTNVRKLKSNLEGVVGQGGYYQPPDNIVDSIGARAVGEKNLRSQILHESQHAIQVREKFSRGSNPSEFTMDWDEKRRIAKNIHKLESLHKESPNDKPVGDALRALKTKLRDSRNPYDTYRRQAGEVEARNVQTRADYTPKQLKGNLFNSTFDTPVENQILNLDDTRAMSIKNLKTKPNFSKILKKRPSAMGEGYWVTKKGELLNINKDLQLDQASGAEHGGFALAGRDPKLAKKLGLSEADRLALYKFYEEMGSESVKGGNAGDKAIRKLLNNDNVRTVYDPGIKTLYIDSKKFSKTVVY